MPANYGRIHRLLKILTLIQGSRGWTSRRLAQECGTTERTIYRDLKMLEGAGIPYFFDPGVDGYSIRKDFFMPPVQLTLDETLALAALAEHVGGGEQVPYTKPAERAISKIRGQLPAALRRELESIEHHLHIRLAASMPPESAADVYEVVKGSLAARTALRCEYESVTQNGAAAKRTRAFLFHPYALFFSQRAWYVVGHHAGHRQIRSLKLNRFTRIEPTDQSYEIPRKFSLSRHLGNAWRMIRGDRRFRIELHFDREFAETIADTWWHPTQDIIWHDDQSITFRCTVDGLDEIVWWIMSMGPHCRVKKPKELAERVQDLAGRMVATYS